MALEDGKMILLYNRIVSLNGKIALLIIEKVLWDGKMILRVNEMVLLIEKIQVLVVLVVLRIDVVSW